MIIQDLISRMLNNGNTIIKIYTYDDQKGLELVESEEKLFSDVDKYADRQVKIWYIDDKKLHIII